jgi:hypothetical protein
LSKFARFVNVQREQSAPNAEPAIVNVAVTAVVIVTAEILVVIIVSLTAVAEQSLPMGNS